MRNKVNRLREIFMRLVEGGVARAAARRGARTRACPMTSWRNRPW
jgi:hypothetical protein